LCDFNIYSKAIEYIHLLSSIQHVTGPTHYRDHPLDLVITKGLPIDISSIVDVALSDRHLVCFTTVLPIAEGHLERIIKKCCLTSEVATDLTECMNNAPSPTLPSSCHDLVDSFNSK
jgi:hypothetical protein